ncbi:MAG: hypothetical protein HYT39_00115 [Candidatus Sungbacteria bacterium]|nr:hypothetical protein [Candidatus Sungbacteria bacterium]
MIYTARQFFIGILVAIIVAGAVGYYLGQRRAKTESKVEPEVSTGLDITSSVLPEGDAGIAVDDQLPGNQVFISKVTLNESRWIAIHEDKNGAPGNIIGAGRYAKGLTASTSIELLRPTVSGVYYAMIHTDDGDSEFDYQKDVPVISDGHAPMTRFLIGKEEE